MRRVGSVANRIARKGEEGGGAWEGEGEVRAKGCQAECPMGAIPFINRGAIVVSGVRRAGVRCWGRGGERGYRRGGAGEGGSVAGWERGECGRGAERGLTMWWGALRGVRDGPVGGRGGGSGMSLEQ